MSNNTNNKGVRSTDKLTAEDVRIMAEQKRSQAREKYVQKFQTTASRNSLIRFGVTAVALLGALGLGLTGISTSGDYDKQISDKQARLTQLDGERMEAENKKNTAPDADAMVSSMIAAGERARALADMQNRLAKHVIPTGEDVDAEAREKATQEYSQMTDDIKRFFTEESFAGGDFMVNGPWIRPQQKIPTTDLKSSDDQPFVQYPADKWGWDVVPSKTVNKTGTVPVLLRAGNTEGVTWAWMKATYDPAVNKFHDMVLMLTADGQETIGATNSPSMVDGAESESDFTDSPTVDDARDPVGPLLDQQPAPDAADNAEAAPPANTDTRDN